MGAKSASVGFLVQPVTSRWPRARAIVGAKSASWALGSGRPKSSPTAVGRGTYEAVSCHA
jgi:hypothetical protein